MTVQTASRIQVWLGKVSMSPRQNTIPRIGTTGTNGVRNGRARFGLLTRRTHTPALTMTNASSVPMLTSSASRPTGKNAANAQPTIPTTIVDHVRGAELRMHAPKRGRKQSVARHRECHARLSHEHDQHRRRQTNDHPDIGQQPKPPQGRDRTQRNDDRRGHVELSVRNEARHHEGHEDVEHRTDGERPQHPDRQIALRILRLLRRRGHGVESDIGEEDQACPARDAAPPELAEVAGVRRDERDASSPDSRRQSRRRSRAPRSRP